MRRLLSSLPLFRQHRRSRSPTVKKSMPPGPKKTRPAVLPLDSQASATKISFTSRSVVPSNRPLDTAMVLPRSPELRVREVDEAVLRELRVHGNEVQQRRFLSGGFGACHAGSGSSTPSRTTRRRPGCSRDEHRPARRGTRCSTGARGPSPRRSREFADLFASRIPPGERPLVADRRLLRPNEDGRATSRTVVMIND